MSDEWAVTFLQGLIQSGNVRRGPWPSHPLGGFFKPHVFLVHAFRTAGLAAQAATVSAMVLRRTAERVRQALNGI